jgi:alpha-L-rhamnosidase
MAGGYAILALALGCSMQGGGLWGGSGPGAPWNLRCEYRTNPLGLDITAPRFSWHVSDPRRGAVQSAYQILAATDLHVLKKDQGTVWDSGKVDSDQSVHVVYGGPALESGHRYFWKVRTWDAGGKPLPYSEPAWWEMGILNPNEWTARWIAAPEPPRAEVPDMKGQWIWHPTEKGEKAKAFFRAPFDIPADAKATSATIRATADDSHVVFVNGRKLGDGHTWNVVNEYDALPAIRPGKNVIAVEAANGAGPCGLILSLRVRRADGQSIELHSNAAAWKVTAKAEGKWTEADHDDSGWQVPAELGRFGDAPWTDVRFQAKSLRSMCMRKEFSVKGKVARARAYASGLGCYELTINGRRVGDSIFTPGWTKYVERIQYQTYDVTDLLKSGPNAVGAMLGNAWWGGFPGWRVTKDGGDALRFFLQVNIEYADGSRESVVTDGAWKVHPSPITRDSFYHGETYDARLEMPGWDSPGFANGAWMPAVVVTGEAVPHFVADRGEPIRMTETLSTKAVTSPAPGVYVFDFGQNMAGWARLKVRAPKDTKITIRFAEVLKPDGHIYRDNYRSAQATDEYICKGEGLEEWQPRFTYRGFRYAEVTSFPGEPPKDALAALAVHSDPPPAGTFTCSNGLLNRLFLNIQWGQRSNMHSVPTDCPQRDERLGWMGDAQAFAPTACWNMMMANFFAKWMHDITDSQGEDGHVTDVAPVAGTAGPAAPGWGDAVVVVPWTLYQFYGDKRIIEENYDGMKRWVEYMRKNAPNDLYEREGYGDWIAIVESPKKPIGAAYYYWCTKLFAQMAAVIGRDADAKEYGALAERIAKAFNEKYLDKDNWYPAKTQTANVLPLWFGIAPKDRRDGVLKNLVEDIKKREYHLSTGFLGTAYLMPLLSEYGHHDVAGKLATQTTFPSWGYMIENGATTIWELWDSDKKGPDMNSRNHFALGAIGQWLYESLGGINIDPANPGFKHIVIRPRPIDGLESVLSTHQSPYGLVACGWNREGGKLKLLVRVPANTTAQLWVPTSDKNATITESGKPILRDGTAAGGAPGLKFVRTEPSAAVFDLGAGTYKFVVE